MPIRGNSAPVGKIPLANIYYDPSDNKVKGNMGGTTVELGGTGGFTQAQHDALPNPHHSNSNDLTSDQKNQLTGGQQTSLHSHSSSGFQFPVGALYFEKTGVNPATTFGYGTWALWGEGAFIVGYKAGDPDFGTVETTGGVKTHTHDNHANHIFTQPSNHAAAATSQADVGATKIGTTTSTATLKAHTHNTPILAHTGGAVDTHSSHSTSSNLPPFKVAYCWERTA